MHTTSSIQGLSEFRTKDARAGLADQGLDVLGELREGFWARGAVAGGRLRGAPRFLQQPEVRCQVALSIGVQRHVGGAVSLAGAARPLLVACFWWQTEPSASQESIGPCL